MWSLFASLLLFTLVYLPYIAIVNPPADTETWPSLVVALASPATLPGNVWIFMYASALVLGLTIGQLDKHGIPESLLRRFGIDVIGHGDVWERLFREQPSRHILVYLKDGSIYGGWPRHVSDDRAEPGPELYLSPAYTWDLEETQWSDLVDRDGVLLHGSEISRIEFLTPESEDLPDSTA